MTELERCKPWIEAALEYSGGTHLFKDVEAGLTKGTLQLWPAPQGCIVTEIVVFPRKRVVNVFLGGGELEQIMEMHGDVIEWAKSQNCVALTMHGRMGWNKPLGKHGWKRQFASYIKDFE